MNQSRKDISPPIGSIVAIRRPIVWGATAFGIGILLDETVQLPLSVWLIATVSSVCFSLILLSLKGRKHHSEIVILLMLAALGGLRHHQYRHLRFNENIASFAKTDSQPARITGVITSGIDLIEAERGPRIPPWMEVDTSRFRMRIESISDGDAWRKTSGVVTVNVNGHVVHAQIGDRVELLGSLSVPPAVKNPGGFDFKEYLHRQGIDALFRVAHPQAVTVLEDSGTWRWCFARFREAIRDEARELFTLNLSKPAKVVALSLLLGDRSQLNEEIRDQFTESGAMHLLAISGLHVGILAGLIAVCCRIFDCSIRTTQFMIIGSVLLFAMLTNHRPPVMRATMLITVLAFGVAANRRIDGFNVLAFCAGVMLLWKPTDLFDIGAQLSFLAVGAIIWSSSILRNQRKLDEEENLPTPENRRWLDWLRPAARVIYQCYFITAAIWLATLPLTIATFHLVAPIGYVLNLILIPYAAVTLSFGYLFLFAGLLFPASGPIFSLPFDYMVNGLLAIVQWAQSFPFGHFHSSGLQTWWLIGYYVLLVQVWGLFSRTRPSNRTWKVLALWIAFGFLFGGQTTPRTGFRYTVLSVGHGLATVIELPTGETILYDAGTFGDGRRAERTVENYLRSRDIKRLDAIFVSHADHDHFSGLFGLLERFSVGTIIVSQPFLDFEQHSVRDLCEHAATRQIPLRIVQAGDQILLPQKDHEEATVLKILHPAVGFHSKHDNANSIVLSIVYAERKILLTGDLEKDGIENLIREPSANFDVAMAPHHGSKHSSPQEFFDWANANYVIVSSGDSSVTPRLQEQLGQQIQVFGTQTSGAVTVEITAQGELRVTSYLHAEEPTPERHAR